MKKTLDKSPGQCYTIIRKREGKPNKPERMNRMDFYSMEKFEIMADMMEEWLDWEHFEQDMETNPYDD